jgi:hypothetical protein
MTTGSIHEQSFTNKLHKTLKSILPNANISFGNYNNNDNNNKNNNINNNNNKPYQLINSYTTSNLKETDTNYLWPDDPAIVSLTDRFDLNSNINNLANLGSLLGISNVQYSNYLNHDLSINKNHNNSSFSTNFYNTFSNNVSTKCNSNNIDQHSIINGEKNFNQISSNDKNNNQHINKFLDETGNKSLTNFNTNSNITNCKMKKELEIHDKELLDANKSQQFHNIKNLNTNLCSNNINNINRQNDIFLNYCENNTYAFSNQANNTNTVNNLSLQQQMFIQQLTANLSSNKKMSNEYKK